MDYSESLLMTRVQSRRAAFLEGWGTFGVPAGCARPEAGS